MGNWYKVSKYTGAVIGVMMAFQNTPGMHPLIRMGVCSGVGLLGAMIAVILYEVKP